MDFVAVQTLLTTAVDGGIIVCDLRWRFPHHLPILPFFLLSRPFCGTFRPLSSLLSVCSWLAADPGFGGAFGRCAAGSLTLVCSWRSDLSSRTVTISHEFSCIDTWAFASFFSLPRSRCFLVSARLQGQDQDRSAPTSSCAHLSNPRYAPTPHPSHLTNVQGALPLPTLHHTHCQRSPRTGISVLTLTPGCSTLSSSGSSFWDARRD